MSEVNWWTAPEQKFLVNNIGKLSAEQIAEKLGRTVGAVNTKIGKLGLTKPNYWTESELQTLRDWFPSLGTGVVSMLPGRTRAAISNKSKEIGVYYRRWTAQEIKVIKSRYASDGPKKLSWALDRTCNSIADKAQRMGLKYTGQHGGARQAVSDQDRANIVRAAQAGYRRSEIASMFGVSISTVSMLVLKAGSGVKRDNVSHLSAEKVARIKRLIGEGLSFRRIAREYGVDPSNISKISRGLTWKNVEAA